VRGIRAHRIAIARAVSAALEVGISKASFDFRFVGVSRAA
jgi:hypothetical protein